MKQQTRELLLDARLPTRWWGMAALAAAHLLRSKHGLPSPAFRFDSRIMFVRDPPSRDSFAPVANLGVIFGPAESFSSCYWVYHQGHISPRANIQNLGVSPDDIEFIKVRMHSSEDPITPPVPQEIATRLLLPMCPACRGRKRAHTRVIGKCERAARPSGQDLLPPIPVASALAPLADDEVALIHSSSNVDTQFSNFKNFEDDEYADVVTNFFSKQTREVTASHSDPETVQIAKYKLFKSKRPNNSHMNESGEITKKCFEHLHVPR